MKLNTSYIELAAIDKTHALFMCADGSERLFKLPDDCVGNHHIIDQLLVNAKYLPWQHVDDVVKLIIECIRRQISTGMFRSRLFDLSKTH